MIDVIQGDITKLEVDPATRERFAEAGAIVNAANKTLLGGGGVMNIPIYSDNVDI
jgi:O-acetyl-ADP-ribose deacetylase (regulator of RNase III)